MELGCSTILYGGYSLDEALDGIAKAGYKAIELCARPGMAPHFKVGQPAAYYEEVKAKIADRGLAIESVAGTDGIAFGSPDYPKVLEAVRAVGGTILAEGSGGTMDDEESFKAFVNAVNDITKYLQQFGVKLSIKPHVGNAVCSTPTVLRFVKEVDTDWVGIISGARALSKIPWNRSNSSRITASRYAFGTTVPAGSARSALWSNRFRDAVLWICRRLQPS